MLNTFSARATFYDIVGYLLPGIVSFGVFGLWIVILGGDDFIDVVMKIIGKHWFGASILGCALSYLAGHCANSFSSFVFEKHIFAKRFENESNWYKRLHDNSPEREAVISKIVDAEFGIELKDLKPFDLLIRMEEYFPKATISGFSFLCFYGMCRTMALLAWLSIIPVGIYFGTEINVFGCVTLMFVHGVGMSLTMVLVGLLFLNQYFRFVKNYYDFLACTLMFRAEQHS